MTNVKGAEIETVTVIGAGTMGHGIAQVFAMAGYDVRLLDVSEEMLSEAIESIEGSLGKLDVDDPEAVLDRIKPMTQPEEAHRDVDFVVEAVPEDLEIKCDVLETADAIAPERAIIASNTSTIPITELSAATDRPDRVVGMHFSNPVVLMETVEVIRGEHTSDEAFDRTIELGEAVGKSPLEVNEDVPGFLGNRVNLRFWLEAIRQVDDGSYEPETIDAAFRRLDFPMGPFELLDFTGLDVVAMCAEAVQEQGMSIHVPSTLTELVEDDALGVKTGGGFYEYAAAGEYERVRIPEECRYEFDPLVVLAPAINEAAWLIDNGVTTKDDVSEMMTVGMNWPRGVLEFADEYGVDRVVETLEELHEETGWAEYEPHSLLESMIDEGELGWRSGSGFYDWKYEFEELENVTYERREFVAVITIERPEKLNALDRAAWSSLLAALERAEADEAVRATAIRGRGPAFCAGDDIAELSSWEERADADAFFGENVIPAFDAVRSHPKPTIAVVDGLATGGGCEMTLLCDLAVASPSSRFALSEALIGALPPWGLTYGLLSLDKKDLMELSLTGRTVSGTEAAEMGIVNYAVDECQVEDVARELARATTAAAPSSVAILKETWTELEDEFLTPWMRTYLDRANDNLFEPDGREGVSSFLNDEEPDWVR